MGIVAHRHDPCLARMSFLDIYFFQKDTYLLRVTLYFPWHRHQAERINRLWCFFQKIHAHVVNETADISKRTPVQIF